MTWDQIQQNWEQFKPRVRERWARLAPMEIDEIQGRRDHLIGRIQNAYGIDNVQAEEQVRDFEDHADPHAGWDSPAGPGRRTD
jgi:uncharacterized protein YjbJ (UPF0337 family)